MHERPKSPESWSVRSKRFKWVPDRKDGTRWELREGKNLLGDVMTLGDGDYYAFEFDSSEEWQCPSMQEAGRQLLQRIKKAAEKVTEVAALGAMW